MKSVRERMDIQSAYREVGSYREDVPRFVELR